jgi:predicted transcriptional regulator of viral defense system
MAIDAMIRRLGGLVTTAELEARGVHPQVLSIAAHANRVIRVRQGWYSVADVSEQVRDACRVGGRLACLSALAHHGLAEQPPELHVALNRSSSRLRLDPKRVIVLHWTRADLTGDRQAVSVEQARQQAARCVHAIRHDDGGHPPDSL